MALPVGSRKRKQLFDKLRNTGNFLNSTTKENVVPVRKPVGDIVNANVFTYLPCKFCKGFYKKKTLSRHVKNCPHHTGNRSDRILAQSDGQSLLSNANQYNDLRKLVFPIMRADKLSLTAKQDYLICAVAQRYLKSHPQKQFYVVTSRKMRQLGKLLIEMRKTKNIPTFMDSLIPENFDLIVSATKLISGYNAESESYTAPSLAANMGTILKDCIDVANRLLIKKYGSQCASLNQLQTLKELIINEWRHEISTIANHDLQQKKWNKPSSVPLVEDLKILRDYLNKKNKEYCNVLKNNSLDVKTFSALQEIVYVQLLLLNRRRVGELQRIKINIYKSHINNKTTHEFSNCISECELMLSKLFKRVVIRGKRGRGVPVLFTEQMVEAIDLLLVLRNNFVESSNSYLFANIKSNNCINGSSTIYKHVRLAGVKNPEALTSTKLRKHLATMSQIVNLSQQDLEQLSTFMGHTTDIHKNYYRLPNDIYQTAKISKLLLLSERGLLSKFKGKSLDDIDINLDILEDDDGIYTITLLQMLLMIVIFQTPLW